MKSLDGAAAPATFITAMMGKQKRQAVPYNRANIIRPFSPDTVGNPSRDIQRKYLVPPGQMRPYDACAAQERKADAAEEGKPAADPEAYSLVSFMVRNEIGSVAEAVRRFYENKEQRCDVMRPEYWGMTWADLQPAGTNKWVNADGLRFPPVEWRDPESGRIYWGLACCGGAPEEPGRRNRYTMLYFKEGEAPELEREFGETAQRRHGQAAERAGQEALGPGRYVRELQARIQYLSMRQDAAGIAQRQAAIAELAALPEARRSNIRTDVKSYRGVRLAGTDAVKARTDAQVAEQRGRRGDGPQDRVHNLPAARRRALLGEAREAINEYKEENPNAGRCEQPAAAQAAAVAVPRGPQAAAPQLVVAEVDEEAAAPPPPPAQVQGPLTVVDLPSDEVNIPTTRRGRAYARIVASTGRRITRPMIRDAYNAAVYGVGPLMRIAYALGVPADKDLRAFQRPGIMKAIAKYAPFYDINTGASKAGNGDILSYPRPNEIARDPIVRLQ